jgi:large subunit ribosomal protein L22
MTAAKTNERPGTRAFLKGFPMSASKARVVLNLIRGEDVQTAAEILAGTTREAAAVIAKVLASAVANAVNNDAQVAEELFVSAAFADEGITAKRFSPRARGRAGKIFKRTCHITVIVSRMDDERLEQLRNSRTAQAAATRSRRVASSRRRADQQAGAHRREAAHEAQAELDAQAQLEAEALEASENELVDETADEAEIGVDAISDYDDETPVDVDDAPADALVDETPTASEENVSDDTTEETN